MKACNSPANIDNNQREQYNFGHEIFASKCVRFLVPPPPILFNVGNMYSYGPLIPRNIKYNTVYHDNVTLLVIQSVIEGKSDL